jgi:Patatin-like phospholipase
MESSVGAGILMRYYLSYMLLGRPPNIERCPRILSLDGGGVRGLSSLLILRNMMEEIARRNGIAEARPCQYFDLIGGTGTGGLIAIMLGRLGMVDLALFVALIAAVGR